MWYIMEVRLDQNGPKIMRWQKERDESYAHEVRDKWVRQMRAHKAVAVSVVFIEE